MTLFQIVILFLFVLWFAICCILFSLATAFKLSHVGFYDLKKDILNKTKDLNKVNFMPLDNNSKIELGHGENIYYTEENLYYKNSEYKRKEKKILDETLNNCFYLLKEAYLTFSSKNFLEYQKIYITNKKIIIETKKEYLLIPFSKFNKLFYSMSRIEGSWKPSLLIYTDKKEYRICFKNLEIINFLKQNII